MKFQIVEKMRFNFLFFWQVSAVVFLLLFVVILFLGMVCFGKTQEHVDIEVGEIDFKPIVIKIDLLQQVATKLDKKEEIFNEMLNKKFYIKDPSL